MTKEEAIRATAKFLVKAYSNGDNEKHYAIEDIKKAEANGDTQTLCNALNGIINFCYYLKTDLDQDERHGISKWQPQRGC